MTIFAYRFPLDLVYRILDIIFAEGSESVLRFSLALIKNNRETIITLDFEKLLEYLKSGLFDTYSADPTKLVHDAANIKLSKSKLEQWEVEHTEMMRRESPDYIDAEKLRNENRTLCQNQKRLERQHEALNTEHAQLASEYILEKQNTERLQSKIEALTEQVAAFKQVFANDTTLAQKQFSDEVDRLTQRNFELQESHALCQEEIRELRNVLSSSDQAVDGDTTLALENSQS